MKIINAYIRGFILSDKYYRAFIFFTVMCVLGYKFVDEPVIGVPVSIYLIYGFFSIGVLVALFKQGALTFANVAKSIFVNYIVFYLFVYLLFCLISILWSTNAYSKTVSCPLVGATSSLRNKAVYYRLDSSEYRLNTYGEIVSEISKKKNYSDYNLLVTFRPGWLGSKVIEGVELVEE